MLRKQHARENPVYTLSGGAAYGYAHIGVLKYLEQRHVYPKAVVGTSMGAIVGGLYTAGYDSAEIESIAKKIRSTEMMRLFFPSFPRGGVIDTSGIRDFLHRYVKDTRIEDLPIAFRSVAVDINTGEEIIFDSGLLLDGMLASMSIPAVFNPYPYRGRSLVDGGVLNNLPWNIAQDLGDTHIVVNVAPQKKDHLKERIYTSSLESAHGTAPPDSAPHGTFADTTSGKGTFGKGGAPFPDDELTEETKKKRNPIRSIFNNIRSKEEISFREIVTSLSRKKEGEHSDHHGRHQHDHRLSLPEVVTNVMAIINEEIRLPPKVTKEKTLYLHPDLMEYSLNDFHRADEIIDVGYRTALESDSFTGGVKKLAKDLSDGPSPP